MRPVRESLFSSVFSVSNQSVQVIITRQRAATSLAGYVGTWVKSGKGQVDAVIAALPGSRSFSPSAGKQVLIFARDRADEDA